MHAYPVPPEGEYKIAVSIVLPLKANNVTSGSFNLPAIVASNFNLNGEHSVSMKSSTKMESDVKPLALSITGVGDEKYNVTGSIAADQLKSARNRISVARLAMNENVAVLDRIATKMARKQRLEQIALQKEDNKGKLQEIERLRDLRNDVSEFADAAKTATDQIDDIRRTLHKNSMPPVKPFYDVVSIAPASSAAPKHLVVVIDGSATTREYIDHIQAALSNLPKNVPTEVIVASQETTSLGTPVPLAKALELLRKEQFIGGQDNVKTIVTAAQLAGKTPGGAILWLHGPQPLTNQEIYIISKYVAKPAFYDLTLGTGDTDSVSLFGNNPEIGPFEEVPQLADDLETNLSSFVASWKPGNNNYAVSITQTDARPDELAKLSKQEENEVLWLWANNHCNELLLAKQRSDAATTAAKYGFVSPVSYASIAPTVAAVSGDAFNAASDNDAPQLQGATNGTIGPQEDATVISGLNTAGTVRANNLANLEAMLSIVANLCEVLLGIGGVIFIICGFIEGDTTVEMMGQEVEVTRRSTPIRWCHHAHTGSVHSRGNQLLHCLGSRCESL